MAAKKNGKARAQSLEDIVEDGLPRLANFQLGASAQRAVLCQRKLCDCADYSQMRSLSLELITLSSLLSIILTRLLLMR